MLIQFRHVSLSGLAGHRWLRWIGLLFFVTLGLGLEAGDANAQARNRGYLEACDGSNLCLTGLQCARLGGAPTGICSFECIPGSPDSSSCPNGEPCTSQLALPGVCYCLNNAECNKGACAKGGCKCINGQCVGTRKVGDTCDEVENACDLKLKCASVNNEKRCLPLCLGGVNGPVCDNNMPCVGDGNFSVCKCTDDAHCRATGADYLCRNGICVNKLGIGEVCTNNNQCQTGLSCGFDDRTATRKRCYVTCRTSQNLCLAGETCKNVGGGVTVCRCDQNSPCPNGETCTNGLCGTKPRCGTSVSCRTGFVCVSPAAGSHGVCVPECKTKKDCEADKTVCTRVSTTSACFCSGDRDCGVGNRCVGLRCVKGCTKRSDCTFPEFCRDGACQPPNEGDDIGEPPVGEVTLVDGGEGSTTEKAVKEPGPESKCQPGCEDGEECDETSGQCQIIKLALGRSCTKAEACESGLCVNSQSAQICTKACSSDGDCQSLGLRCVSAEGQQVCHYPAAAPVTEKDNPNALGCCQVNAEPSWIPFFVVLLFFVLLNVRRPSTEND
ncbi:MAG: hypothetical protein EP343_10735 [Deltaproteobacteria bacterium]|nr:MAG: hypothetical protein EP343_10735 [Deltaproteobacteria bacterium]